MNEEMQVRATFVHSQAICAQIEALGMQAENDQRIHRGESLAYDEAAFMQLIIKYDIGHNAVLSYLNEART